MYQSLSSGTLKCVEVFHFGLAIGRCEVIVDFGIQVADNNPSSIRVPTHMVMSLGRGYSTSSVSQTIGRATGNGKSVLQENGFDCVRVLTTHNDLILCTKMRNYMKEISDRMNHGDTLEQAVSWI